jgi:tetratricopeptide (TPR) repeat protein
LLPRIKRILGTQWIIKKFNHRERKEHRERFSSLGPRREKSEVNDTSAFHSLCSLRSLWLIPLFFSLCGCYDEPRESGYTPKTEAVTAYDAAQSALKAGDTDEALARARAAYGADPDFDAAAFLLASLQGRAGQFEEALALCGTLTARSPNFVQAHLLQGILWDRSGNSDAANTSYDTALRCFAALTEPERARPESGLYEALTTFLRHGKLEGVKAINQVLAKYPDYDAALYVKSCMLDKDRGFLLRWFSEQNGDGPKNSG